VISGVSILIFVFGMGMMSFSEYPINQNSELGISFAFGDSDVSFSSLTGVESSSLTTANEISTTTESDKKIPGWIKNSAGWWADDSITDDEFLKGITFLIENQVIIVDATSKVTDSEINEIPSWIKTNAGWWADDSITDDDFLKGITFLIENGIISV